MTDTEVLIEALEKAVELSISQGCGITDPEPGEFSDHAKSAVRAVLAELDRQGLVIVPKHPTKGMQAACCVLSGDDGEWLPETHQNEFWMRMLAAAPKPVEPKL